MRARPRLGKTWCCNHLPHLYHSLNERLQPHFRSIDTREASILGFRIICRSGQPAPSRLGGTCNGKGKHFGEPSASNRRASPESPGNRSFRQCRLRQWPMRFHGSTERLPPMERSFRLVAELRSGASSFGFTSDAVMKDSRSFKYAKSWGNIRRG